MKRLLHLIPLLAVSVHAAPRIIKDLDERGKTAINLNFEEMDRRLNNAVLKTSTQTITGYKYFPNGVVRIKVGTFTSSSSTGNQSITGIGFRPKAVIFYMGIGAADSIAFSMGSATDSTSQAAIGGRSDDTNSGGQTTTSTYCLYWTTVAGAAAGVAQFVSMDSDGFTLNWSTADSRLIGYIAFQ